METIDGRVQGHRMLVEPHLSDVKAVLGKCDEYKTKTLIRSLWDQVGSLKRQLEKANADRIAARS